MEEEIRELIVDNELAGLRIDKLISVSFEDVTRNHIQKLIEDGNVLVNGKACLKSNYKCKEGDLLEIKEEADLSDIEIMPENIDIDIVYEDEDIVIVNKPVGMVVHPAPGHYSGTLVNAMMYICAGGLSGINGVIRPGIVHRIDKDTSGLLVVCKNDKAHNSISEQLSVHSITRVYYCIVNGKFKENEGTVDKPIGRSPSDRKKMAANVKNGRNAVTHYKVLYSYERNYSIVECRLETGRTHQIRVHMASIGHPLLGDVVYGSSKQPYELEGQLLHAGVLGFIHPSTKEYVEFKRPLPDRFVDVAMRICMSTEEKEYVKTVIDAINR